MQALGCSPTSRFSLDEAIADFMLWVERKQEEKVIGKAPERTPKQGQTWVPKYPTLDAIFAEYGEPEAEPEPAIDPAEIARVIADLDAAHEPEF